MVLFAILGEQLATLMPSMALSSLILLTKCPEFDDWKYRLALLPPVPPHP